MENAATPLVTPAEMAAVDCAAIGSGIDGYRLMDAAGAAVAACALRHHPRVVRAVALCGPGNNGGDGYVAARHLRAAGVDVDVFSLIDPERLTGDAARARDDWAGPIGAMADVRPKADVLIVDALFGGGLDRPIEGAAKAAIERINQAEAPVIAADLPSGISGRSGEVCGVALRARHTVTFVAPKPGHFLLPGAVHRGALHVVDIGIPERFARSPEQKLWLNTPAAWAGDLPVRGPGDHKYVRGHLSVFSGGFARTGAARLAALTGLRAGAGLVTVLAPGSALAADAAHLTAIMLHRIDDENELDAWLRDERLNSFVLGPAFGIGDRARRFTERVLAAGRALVLDADGLTSFAADTDGLCSFAGDGEVRLLLTPHQGEFGRLFPDLVADPSLSKIDRARLAAERVHAVVLYKGADTVVAAPDGRAVVSADAPPWLATAGSGDCLAGLAGGLIAQGMPLFAAAAAAAYMHGAAGQAAGEGLTAEDLPGHLPTFTALRERDNQHGRRELYRN